MHIPETWLEASVWSEILEVLARPGSRTSYRSSRGAHEPDNDGSLDDTYTVDGAVVLSSLVLAQSALPGIRYTEAPVEAGISKIPHDDIASASDEPADGTEATTSSGRLFGHEPAWSLLFYASDLDRDGSIEQLEITRGMEGLGFGWSSLVAAVASEAAGEAKRLYEDESGEGMSAGKRVEGF